MTSSHPEEALNYSPSPHTMLLVPADSKPLPCWKTVAGRGSLNTELEKPLALACRKYARNVGETTSPALSPDEFLQRQTETLNTSFSQKTV